MSLQERRPTREWIYEINVLEQIGVGETEIQEVCL